VFAFVTFDAGAPGFLPLVRQDYRIFKIDRILLHDLHSALRLGRITLHR
jgi:hypothetical protein